MAASAQALPLTETITPADPAAVAEAVRNASRNATPVYPIGGGTRLDYGGWPTAPGIGLSLAGLNEVIAHDAPDMTITVAAGLTIAELGRRLAAERQRLPVDVRHADRATVGGTVATDPSGPRRYAHGTLRDYVIGVRAVDGLGTAFAGGGRVVKNAAGYNLCRLLVGSLGTLAVITEVTLMVRPIPEASALVACDLPDLHTAERLLTALINTETLPVAIELQAGLPRPDQPPLPALAAKTAARLFVGFEGSQAEVQWMAEKLHDEWRRLGISSPQTIAAPEADQAWDWLKEFDPQVQMNVLPGATADAIGRVLELDPNCSVQAHAGNGVIGVRFSAAVAADLASLLDDRLRPAVSQVGGRVVVLSCPDGAQLNAGQIWGPPGDAARLIRALKDRFDPQGVLNPGRFVCGN